MATFGNTYICHQTLLKNRSCYQEAFKFDVKVLQKAKRSKRGPKGEGENYAVLCTVFLPLQSRSARGNQAAFPSSFSLTHHYLHEIV